MCRTDVEGVTYDWERREMDGATSSTCCDSKRVETDPLAIEKEGQRKRRKRTKNDLPRPSTPPPEHPRLLTNYVDPLRRQGQIKLRSGMIRRTKMKKSTHQIVQPHRGQIRCIKCIRDIAYEVQMLGSISRQDTGAAQHCRGRGYKIACTQHYPSRDLPYMDTARCSCTRMLILLIVYSIPILFIGIRKVFILFSLPIFL